MTYRVMNFLNWGSLVHGGKPVGTLSPGMQDRTLEIVLNNAEGQLISVGYDRDGLPVALIFRDDTPHDDGLMAEQRADTERMVEAVYSGEDWTKLLND